MASLTDVLSVVQNGVVAFSNLGKQMAGSLLNISGQLTTNSSAIAAANVNIAALQALVPAPNIANSLSSNVLISNSVYTDGPIVAQGSSGVWSVSGTVTILDTNGPAQINFKLWDNSTVIDSTRNRLDIANGSYSTSLSGIITNPSSNIRISANSNSSSTSFQFNASGNSKDCTVTAIRIG
jgi:hypothetical protein